MGIFPAKYTYKGKTVEGYKIYCGQKSDGRKIVKWAKTLREAKEIEQLYKKTRSQIDSELLALPATAKTEIINVINQCASSRTTLTEIFNYWAESQFSAGAKTVKECADLYLESLKEAGRKERYIEKMKLFLRKLSAFLGNMPIHTVKLADLEEIFFKISIKTRPTWKKMTSAFWSWSVRKGYCSQNVAMRLDSTSVEYEVPQILTVEQCRLLLAKCSKTTLPVLVLMLFAGIRPFEAIKVGWRDVDFEARTIIINATVAKTRSFRKISMSDNLFAWMEFLKNKKLPLPYRRARGQALTAEFAQILDYDSWPRDCLRHTAASMMLEKYQSADKAALELGNSPAILHRHYKNLVSRKDCKEFWSLFPKNVL